METKSKRPTASPFTMAQLFTKFNQGISEWFYAVDDWAGDRQTAMSTRQIANRENEGAQPADCATTVAPSIIASRIYGRNMGPRALQLASHRLMARFVCCGERVATTKNPPDEGYR